jgi:O-succinylbenzoic acid--CoA ligase
VSPNRLLAVLQARPAAARTVLEAWDRGDAVAVLDPAAPDAVLDQTLARLRPTHLVVDETRAVPGGRPPDPDIGAVVVTSGTTGDPKAVELTFAGLDAVGAGCNASLEMRPDDRWLVCLPLHHVAGLAILARARAGGHPVDVHARFDVDAAAAAPERHGSTVVSVVPTMLHRLLAAGAPLDAYRRIVVGGAPFPTRLRDRAAAAGAPVVDAYGLSETAGGVVLDGQPVPGAEVDLGPDGEIRVRGPMVMRRYRFEPDATRAVLDRDGWLDTGDLGRRDERGRVLVVDRRRDLVITGGVNVSPTAVEQVLVEHPSVAEVCVAGVPDEQWGERLVAYVVARPDIAPPTVEELRDFGRSRLGAAELPRQVVEVAAIPRTAGGKVQRRQLPAPT